MRRKASPSEEIDRLFRQAETEKTNGRLIEAVALAEQARGIGETKYGMEHPQLGHLLFRIIKLYINMDPKFLLSRLLYLKILSYAQIAISSLKKEEKKNWFEIVFCYASVCAVYIFTKKPQDVLSPAQKGLEILDRYGEGRRVNKLRLSLICSLELGQVVKGKSMEAESTNDKMLQDMDNGLIPKEPSIYFLGARQKLKSEKYPEALKYGKDGLRVIIESDQNSDKELSIALFTLCVIMDV